MVSNKARNCALLLLAPLGIQLMLFKLIKCAILSGATAETARAVPQENLVVHMLATHASVPALLITVSLFLLVIVVSQFSLSGSGATALALGLWAFISAAATRLLPGNQLWLDERFYAAVRWDLMIVLMLAIVVVFTLDRVRGVLRGVTLTSIHLVVCGMMLLASLDFGYFVMTGSLADSFMLRYVFTNASNLSYVLLHELKGTKLLLMLLPVALSSVSLAYSLGPRRPSPRSAWPAGILGVATLLVALVPGHAVSDHAAVLSRSTFGELIARVADRGVSDRAIDLAATGEPLFDTKQLRLAGTASATPNIVFVVLESQRHPFYLKPGLLFTPTPFLDRLVEHSLVADEMYAVVPHTNKALVPILCGVYPRISQGDEPDVPGRCLPELLTDLGYRSAFFTPATLAFEGKDQLLKNMGFNEMFGDGDYDRTGFERVNYFGHEERIMLGSSMGWVDAQVDANRPFMAAYLTTTPHHPYTTASHFPERAFGDPRPDFNNYLNAIAYVDDFLRQLVGEYEARGLTRSTIFVIVGDHGEAFGEHGLRYHSAVPYDEVLKVPALVFAPGLVSPGSTATAPRQQIDLLPTIAQLMGGHLEGGSFPGVSLLRSVPEPRRLYHAGWIENQSMAMRDGYRKTVYHFGRRPTEVFDLRNDPTEQSPVELAPGSVEAERVAETLHLWRARVNASYGK